VKQPFAENGINFDFPTVKVAVGTEPAAIVSRQALEITKASASRAHRAVFGNLQKIP
jgi:hypothetical protein